MITGYGKGMVLKEEVGQGLCDAIWAPGEAMSSQKYLHTSKAIVA